MTCTPFNIKVVEGNDFALLLPLKRRTYTANVPIDEDIDATELQNVVFKIGAQEYTPELGTDGVRVVVTDKPARGTYDIVLTATYRGSVITAAYFEALTIVAWNYQSNAEQYIQGSPIEMQCMYVIGGALTDAELQELKRQYIAAKEAMEAATEEAEAAKESFDNAAEALGNLPVLLVEQQGTINNQQRTIGEQQTLIGQLSGGVVMMSDAEYAPALADLATKLI